jgi:hypothetical protein
MFKEIISQELSSKSVPDIKNCEEKLLNILLFLKTNKIVSAQEEIEKQKNLKSNIS